MAITINLTDANEDGKGINFNAYMKTFDKKYFASDYGGFTNMVEEGKPFPGGHYVAGGDDYVTWDGKRNGQSVIFEGGDQGWAYYFDGKDDKPGNADDHTMSGDIQAITFGTQTKTNSDKTDYTNNGEIRILFAEFDVPNYSNSFLSGISDGNLKKFYNYLNSDSIEFVGSTGKDIFTSYNKDDILHGEGGNDALNGGKGNDTIYGDEGNDRLSGGKGNDIFVFEVGDGKDKITDFGKSGGADQLDFSGFFVDYDDVMDHAVSSKAGVTISYGDTDSVLLQGVKLGSLTADDFVFMV